MHLCILIPDPAYPEPFAWAFHVEAEALREAGAEVTARPWTQPGDLTPFDLVLPLVAWGYHLRFTDWLALLDRLEAERVRVVNPVPLLRWNSDKAYLTELGASGVPTVPTLAVDHLNEAALTAAHGVFASDELVIKPPVSASAWGTFRLGRGDPVPEEVFGDRMLIQPWLGSVTTDGEYSLFVFGGEVSHAVVKRPKAGDFRVQPDHGGTSVACEAPEGAVELARAALEAAPAEAAYARVDMLRGNDGALQIIELELIEPALFLHNVPEAKGRFAAAILSAAERASE
ncbi:RimK family alpha-L-glutamate ligase [Sphingomonas sp. GCM10030256]|uniref:ATP-grasp domain-containing protein n=1 Tax=Sphingomonas sp. GCM10030256 TaxID=3273427 RepID=UPI003607B2E9